VLRVEGVLPSGLWESDLIDEALVGDDVAVQGDLVAVDSSGEAHEG
jgi:hypothetical protein